MLRSAGSSSLKETFGFARGSEASAVLVSTTDDIVTRGGGGRRTMGKRPASTAGYILARGAPVNFCWGWVHETPSRCANRGAAKASVALPPSPQLSFGETYTRHGQGCITGVLRFSYVVQTKRKPTIPPHCCCPTPTWPRFVGVVWAPRATRGYPPQIHHQIRPRPDTGRFSSLDVSL